MRIKNTQRRSTDDRPVPSKGKGSAVSDSSGASKAEIVQQMVQTIAQKGLTQRVVGELLGVSQPKVSLMLRGQLNSYTTEQLSGYLKILNGQPASGSSTEPTTKAAKAPRASKTAKATKPTKAKISSNNSGDLASKIAIIKQISKEIARSGLSQRVVGNLLGISQPKISLMLRGQLNSYTAEQLSGYLNTLTNQSGSVATTAKTKTSRRGPKPKVKAPAKAAPPTKAKASTKASAAGDLAEKANIVKKIAKEIQGKGISQRVVGELLGLSQPQVSLLLRGRYNAYSVEQLSKYLDVLSGQSSVATSPLGRRKGTKSVPPLKTVSSSPVKTVAQPDAPADTGASIDTPSWMLEEISYLRQQLALAGSQRGDDQLLAEIDFLRRENAALQKKTARFDQMTALLQV